MHDNKVAFDLFLKIQNAGREVRTEEDEQAAQKFRRVAQAKFDDMFEERERRQSMSVREDQVSKCIDRHS